MIASRCAGPRQLRFVTAWTARARARSIGAALVLALCAAPAGAQRGGLPDYPTEVDLLCGDAAKAREKLGWSYHIRFEDLVREMVESDCRALGALVVSEWFARRAGARVHGA